jgi:hypothetical protein
MSPYLRLLADPCRGDITVPAPYVGTGSGFVLRCTDHLQAGTATGTSVDGAFFLAPGNTNLMYSAYLATASSSQLTLGAQAFASLAGSIAFRMRCKALCAEWIPTGPINGRSGMVGLFYEPNSMLNPAGSAPYTQQLLNQSQITAPNGSMRHEVKWVPTDSDQIWYQPGTTFNTAQGGAAVGIVLKGVDATAGLANGYLKVTSVWEYVLNLSGNGAASVVRPPAFSLNQALASVPSVLDIVFNGVMGGPAAGLIAAGAAYASTQVPRLRSGAVAMNGQRRLRLNDLD